MCYSVFGSECIISRYSVAKKHRDGKCRLWESNDHFIEQDKAVGRFRSMHNLKGEKVMIADSSDPTELHGWTLFPFQVPLTPSPCICRARIEEFKELGSPTFPGTLVPIELNFYTLSLSSFPTLHQHTHNEVFSPRLHGHRAIGFRTLQADVSHLSWLRRGYHDQLPLRRNESVL